MVPTQSAVLSTRLSGYTIDALSTYGGKQQTKHTNHVTESMQHTRTEDVQAAGHGPH